LVEFGAYFYLPWFQGICVFFANEKTYVLVAALLSLEIGVCHPYRLV
jgi:hypothetical protein